ncbi:MAG: hypothetical protein MJ099_07005, partial [Clostridia bacterium]|nr:hypothetical protein [Clostridia bacterium]
GSSVNSQSSWSLTMAEDGGVTMQNNTSSKYFLLFSGSAFTVSKTNADPIALYDADGKKLTAVPASPFKAYVCNPDGSKVLSSSTATEDPEKKVTVNYVVTDQFALREDFASGTRMSQIGDAAVWKFENGKLTCGAASFAYADGKLQNAAIEGGKLVSGTGTVEVQLWKKGDRAADQKDTYLFVTSDPHYKYRADFSSSLPADTQESIERLDSLINKASEDFGGIYFDSFISCGDNGDGNKSIVSGAFWDHVGKVIETAASNEHVLNTFFVLGNHEWHNGNYTRDTTNAVAKQFRQNGYVEEHDDYVLYSFGSEEDSNVFVAEDIAKLDSYLATAPTDKPIFVVSHFPAHNYEQEMTLGEDVISTLTKYGDTHQLVFLWGHNHDEEDPHYGIVYTDELDGQPINFTYASGGCLNDVEYSSHSRKIAAKAFVAKIDEAKDLSITYYDINGNALSTTKAVKPEGHDFVKGSAAAAPCAEAGAAVACGYCNKRFRYCSAADGKNEMHGGRAEH